MFVLNLLARDFNCSQHSDVVINQKQNVLIIVFKSLDL